jgi:hypothetical protein
MDVREPNLYLLQGYGLQVSLALSSFSGKPQLTYHDAAQVRQFTGEEITFEDTVLGRFASVVLTSVPDLGTTIFSLVLPAVRLSGAGGSQPITTIGITAVQRTTIAGPPPGQSTTLQVIELTGTAEAVEF